MSRILAAGLAVAALLCGVFSFFNQLAAASSATHPILVAFRLSAYLGVLVLSCAFIAIALSKRRVGFWLLTFSLILSTIASLDAVARTSPQSSELHVVPQFQRDQFANEPLSLVDERRLVLGTAVLSGGALLSLVPIPGAVALTFIICGATIALALALRTIMPIIGTGFTIEGISPGLIEDSIRASESPLALWCTLALLALASAFGSYFRSDIRIVKRFALLSSTWILWFSGLVALAVGLLLVAPDITAPQLKYIALHSTILDSTEISEPGRAGDPFHEGGTDFGLSTDAVGQRASLNSAHRIGAFSVRTRDGAFKPRWLIPLTPLMASILLLSFVAFSGIHAFSIRTFAGIDALRRLASEKTRERDSIVTLNSRIEAAMNSLEREQVAERSKVLMERAALLKEIHHRVKNNLQIIMSFINLQLRNLSAPDAQAALQESRGRIRSIALIHEVLYRTGDFLGIDIRDYIEQLCDEYQSVRRGESHIEFNVSGDGVRLNLDQAIPAGMAVSETISALTRAAHAERLPRLVRIEVKQSEARFEISITGGAPFPDTGDAENRLELRFVRALVAQFDGSLDFLPESAEGRGRIIISGALDVLSSVV